MKKLLLLLIFAASAAFGQTTTSVTGQIKDLSGANVTSGQVSFTLQPGIDTSMSGTARFTPSEIDCSITGTGAVKALDGVSTCTVTNNTALQPSGTSYKVCIQPQFIQPGSCFVTYATGTTIDVTSQIPTPPLTPAYNLVDTFSNQTIAGNKTFTGSVVYSGSLTFGALNLSGPLTETNGGTLGGTFAGNVTWSGNQSFNGNVSVGGTLTRKISGRTCYADQYFGADAGAKMIAAEADSSCSIVDATGFTGAQSGSSTVTATVPLILGAYTYTSSANPAISVGTQSALSGQGMLATIIASSSNTADVVKVPSTSIRWSIHDLQITQPSTRSAGATLRISGGNGSINNVYLPIFFDGMFFDTAVTAGANVVTHFYLGNATDSGTPHCGIRNGGVSSGTVSSNQFENGIILETANYSDAEVCIQDGSDTIMFTNFQAVWDVVHAGTVAFHTEVINGGSEPYDIKCTNCVFEAGASANVMNFDKIRAFECTNCTASGGLDGVALNGGVASGSGEWTWIGGKITNNHHHGLDILTGGIGQITVIGARFGDNGQSTNNTYDDINNVGAGNVQLIGLEFNTVNSVLPTNLPKWNIEIGPGVCGNYTIVGNNYAQAGVSGTVSNGCTSSTGLSLDANSGALNIIGGGILRTPKNVARVTSDFTSANSAALQAITGLSFSLPAVAINYVFHCSVIFSQATNVAGDQFGVALLTTAPTAVSVNSFVAQNITAGTILNGNLLGLSTTTPTAFVTFQPAITGSLGATWDGVIEASGSGASTLQFYVLNGTAADVIVVKKDSFCTLAAQ